MPGCLAWSRRWHRVAVYQPFIRSFCLPNFQTFVDSDSICFETSVASRYDINIRAGGFLCTEHRCGRVPSARGHFKDLNTARRSSESKDGLNVGLVDVCWILYVFLLGRFHSATYNLIIASYSYVVQVSWRVFACKQADSQKYCKYPWHLWQDANGYHKTWSVRTSEEWLGQRVVPSFASVSLFVAKAVVLPISSIAEQCKEIANQDPKSVCRWFVDDSLSMVKSLKYHQMWHDDIVPGQGRVLLSASLVEEQDYKRPARPGSMFCLL